MSLSREAVLPLETEDQLEQALGSRQVIEYASQDATRPTALPSPTPISLSHLFLHESASDMLLAAVPRPESSPPHPSCSYDPGANDYPSDPFLLGSQQADSDEDNDSPTASPLLTSLPHLLRESYDDSYDMSVRPLIGCETTPFFNLAPVSAASSPHTPPPYILYPPDLPIPCRVCKVVNNYETTQCSYCREEWPIWNLSCDTTVAQHFCESDQYCRSALNTARIRRYTWLALNKQGESMIETSRKDGENVFTKLKELNPNLIPLGCPSHLIHKSAQVAGERGLSVDVESIAMKITSFFSGERSGIHQRHQRFAEFCDFLDVQYRKFPNHGQTRWLTLYPLIERILQLWEPLKSYFLSNDICPRIFELFFESDLCQCYFLFLHSALKLFNTTNLILQKSNLLLPEMIRAIRKLQLSLQDRCEKGYFGAFTEIELGKIDNIQLVKCFRSECLAFYEISLEYLNKWLHLDSLPQNLDWLLLEDLELINYSALKKSVELLCPEISTNDDLFDEVCCLQRTLRIILNGIIRITKP